MICIKKRLWSQCFEPCAALRAMLSRVFQFIGLLYAFGVPKRSRRPQFMEMNKLKGNWAKHCKSKMLGIIHFFDTF